MSEDPISIENVYTNDDCDQKDSSEQDNTIRSGSEYVNNKTSEIETIVTETHLNSDDLTHGTSIIHFNDADCGEPFAPHQLVFDFRPGPGDAAVAKKCNNFWTYINSRPELKQFMAVPDKIPRDLKTHRSSKLSYKETSTDENTDKEDENTVAMKLLMDEKVVNKNTFATMRRNMYCDSYNSLGGKQWEENIEPKLPTIRKHSHNVKPEVKAICNEMASFDLAHPRSFDPPGHHNPLHHAPLQKMKL